MVADFSDAVCADWRAGGLAHLARIARRNAFIHRQHRTKAAILQPGESGLTDLP